MKQSGIYSIVHLESGRRYIGSAVDIQRRWCEHRHFLRHGKHINRRLRRAWARDGADAFRFEVVELVDDAMQLHVREQAQLDLHYPLVYNVGPAAKSPWLGVKRGPLSEEWRARIGASVKGLKRKPFTPEHREKLAAAKRGRPNLFHVKKYSDESRAKMSESAKRRWQASAEVAV